MLLKLKKVKVTWEDACSADGPFVVTERGFKGLMTESVGWLIEKNKDYVVIAQDIHCQAAENTMRAVITIPRKIVKKITVLK
jgi:hypothetical protein